MTADEPDEELIARFAQGDGDAFDTLYRRHEMRVWRYLVRSVDDRALADDLLQDTWFAVAREAPRYRPTAKFTTWLFTLAHNRMIDACRARRPQSTVDVATLDAIGGVPQLMAAAGSEPLASTLAGEQWAAMVGALGRLPREQCEAFLLQVEGDCSIDAIAAITGSSFETAKSRLRYARVKLRELLKEYA